MEKNEYLKINLGSFILMLFELVVGILLLVKQDQFARYIFIAFGVVLLVVGVINLVRFLIGKRNGEVNNLNIVAAVVSLILGAVFTFGVNLIMGVFQLIAIIFAIMLIIASILKIQGFVERKRGQQSVSILTLVSAIAGIVMAVIIIIRPLNIWVLLGISMIVLAVLDILSFILFKR